MNHPELLIFRLDDLLVASGESVDAAVRRTVQQYFAQLLGLRGGGALVPPPAVSEFREAGFGNPAQLSAALIRYLLSLLPADDLPPRRESRTVNEAVARLRQAAQPVQGVTMETLRERADFASAATRIRERGGGAAALAAIVGGEWKHPLLVDQGDLEQGNLVERLFYEIYLGNKHFGRALRKRRNYLYRGPGLIESETLRIAPDRLRALHERYRGRMALLTERPLALARLALDLLRVEPLFAVVVTQEDVTAEAARRQRLARAEHSVALPQPFLLLEAAASLDRSGEQRTLYAGITRGDAAAARAAAQASGRPFVACLVPPPHATPQEEGQLAQTGADLFFADPEALVSWLLAGEE